MSDCAREQAEGDLLQGSVDFRSQTPPWLCDDARRLGKDYLDDVVPPPWTPVSVRTRGELFVSIGCWGRDYLFQASATALPTQISSQGTNLLARPIELQLFVNGARSPVHWSNAKHFAPAISKVKGSLKRTATAAVGQSTVTLTTKATVEYDGFAWFELMLTGLPPGTVVDGLDLVIPVSPAVALYSHRTTAPGDPLAQTYKSYSGLARRHAGHNGLVDWVTGFIPFWWLGNNDVGLQWTVEDARAWPNWNRPDPRDNCYPIELQQIDAAPACMLQRLRLLRNQVLPSGWKFEFGLQATPVKPRPADWRKWRLGTMDDGSPTDPLHGKSGTVKITEIGGQVTSDADERAWTVAFGYPEVAPSHAAAYNDAVSKTHAAGGKVIQYALLTEMSDASPEWSSYGVHWKWKAIPSAACQDPNGYPAGASLCNTDPGSTFADFIVWKTHQFLSKPTTDGFYHDQSVLYFLYPGWTDSANVQQPTYPIRAYRDLYRRIYILSKKMAPGCCLVANMSGEMNMAVLAYEDACLNGEQLVMRTPVVTPATHAFIDRYISAGSSIMSLEEFRAEFMGRQWGLVPFFYPWSDPYAPGRAAADEVMAVLMLHDVGKFGNYLNPDRVAAAYALLDAFGIVDAAFFPYFAQPAPVATGDPDVHGSVYKRPDGQGLVVLANFNASDVQVVVKLNPTIFPTVSKVSSLTPSPEVVVAPENGGYAVQVPGHGDLQPGTYKLLRVEP